jgi:uncharacterized protein (DUF2237 family)
MNYNADKRPQALFPPLVAAPLWFRCSVLYDETQPRRVGPACVLLATLAEASRFNII